MRYVHNGESGIVNGCFCAKPLMRSLPLRRRKSSVRAGREAEELTNEKSLVRASA